LVFSYRGKLAELNARDLGADGRSELLNLTAVKQEVFETGIGA
jgi:hypothetical protein